MSGKDDDAESGDASTSVVRYPCMPSLVSLNQMRNRLHLAYTGKKLMKWTALATGKELRRLGWEIVDSYTSFRDDMRNCFMLLARARYFTPLVNDSVLNNVGSEACMKVEKGFKSVAGVKVMLFIARDNGNDPSPHLGIGQGGVAINDAKKAWRELLKRLVFMAQARVEFLMLEDAHKNATKRQNVLARIVEPRTMATIQYIKTEIEEFSREEFYRIKKILANKYKRKKDCQHTEFDSTCLSCIKRKASLGEQREDKQSEEVTEKEEKTTTLTNAEKLPSKGLFVEEVTVEELLGKDVLNEIDIYEEALKIKEESTVEKNDEALSSNKDSVNTIKTVKTIDVSGHDLELGVFEIETEDTTKIVRVKNEDGTISEQKKIIRKKKETRSPYNTGEQSSIDARSSKSKNDKTVGIVTINKSGICLKNTTQTVQSRIQHPEVSMVDKFEKCCLSTGSILSVTNFNCFSKESINSICENKSLTISSNRYEEKFELFESNNVNRQSFKNTLTKYNDIEKEKFGVTDSERILLQNNVNKSIIMKSKSIVDTENEIKKKKVMKSNSLDINVFDNYSGSGSSNN